MDRKAMKQDEPNKDSVETHINSKHGYLKCPATAFTRNILSFTRYNAENTIAYSEKEISESAKLHTRKLMALCLKACGCFMRDLMDNLLYRATELRKKAGTAKPRREICINLEKKFAQSGVNKAFA